MTTFSGELSRSKFFFVAMSALLVSAGMLTPASVSGYEWQECDTCGTGAAPPVWKSWPIQLHVHEDLGSVPGSCNLYPSLDDDSNSGLNDAHCATWMWNLVPRSDITFDVIDGYLHPDYPSGQYPPDYLTWQADFSGDGVSTILAPPGGALCQNYLGSGTLGCTLISFDANTSNPDPEIVDMDIMMDAEAWDDTFVDGQSVNGFGPRSPHRYQSAGAPRSLRPLLTHEIGHGLGFAHDVDKLALMSHLFPFGGLYEGSGHRGFATVMGADAVGLGGGDAGAGVGWEAGMYENEQVGEHWKDVAVTPYTLLFDGTRTRGRLPTVDFDGPWCTGYTISVGYTVANLSGDTIDRIDAQYRISTNDIISAQDIDVGMEVIDLMQFGDWGRFEQHEISHVLSVPPDAPAESVWLGLRVAGMEPGDPEWIEVEEASGPNMSSANNVTRLLKERVVMGGPQCP